MICKVSQINFLPNQRLWQIKYLLTKDKSQDFAQPCPKIFIKYFSCCAHSYCFDSLEKKNISLDQSVTSPVYIPLFQVRKMMIITNGLNWHNRVFFRHAVITWNHTSREWVASQTIIGHVKELTSRMPWIWLSWFPRVWYLRDIDTTWVRLTSTICTNGSRKQGNCIYNKPAIINNLFIRKKISTNLHKTILHGKTIGTIPIHCINMNTKDQIYM